MGPRAWGLGIGPPLLLLLGVLLAAAPDAAGQAPLRSQPLRSHTFVGYGNWASEAGLGWVGFAVEREVRPRTSLFGEGVATVFASACAAVAGANCPIAGWFVDGGVQRDLIPAAGPVTILGGIHAGIADFRSVRFLLGARLAIEFPRSASLAVRAGLLYHHLVGERHPQVLGWTAGLRFGL